MLTAAQRHALATRADLLAEECRIKMMDRVTWAGRLAALGDYGSTGGSAADRRLIVEAMAAIEKGRKDRP